MTISNQPEEIRHDHPFGMRLDFFLTVQSNTIRARDKHPDFTDCRFKLLALLAEELGEAARAAYEGDPEGFRRELVDMVSLIQRNFEGDMKQGANICGDI
ncbi:hypothetical protein LJC59_00185 [Desulfovibrio sp. OttesenSCG-928-A18]|nr:hypothetical protein [Desulfovibrio sp. OttesenSCG-928-A18]